MTINVVDLIAVFTIGLAVFLGWRSGFLIQALALIGFVGGIAGVVLVAPHAAGLAEDIDPFLRTIVVVCVLGGIVLIAQAVGGLVGSALRRKLGRGVLGGVDQGFGAAFGFARGVFMVWLIGGLIGVVAVPGLAAEARQSLILRAIETRLPSPIVLAAELGRLIQAAGLPDIFVGAPPPAETPAGGPTAQEAEGIAAAARRSTVRVESLACGQFLTGTGFAVSSDHFVTNAHVVAGTTQTWISFDGSLDRFEAVVVEFDPQLDAALLYVPRANVTPLTLAPSLPERGEDAAGLGFTGGGRQRAIPAVVSRTLSALGRDIYGQGIAAREVIEMAADVAPGDSGGPVILPNGEVGGVTFSESREDPAIGYALSPVAVAASIGDELGARAATATGACIR